MQLQQPQSATAQRNYGVDALRILSIYMVLVLHVLGMGGGIGGTKPFSANHIAAWSLEIGAFCAVNCYGLISGYVGINAKYRYTNLIMLWLQVLLYSLASALICRLQNPASVGFSELLDAAFPMMKGTFWYFTAYSGLFFLLPLLNRAVLALNRRQALVLCLTIAAVFSLMPILLNEDTFTLASGYTPLWLMLLYVLGACIRRFDFGRSIGSGWLFLIYGASVALALGAMVVLMKKWVPFLSDRYSAAVLVNYTAPTILLCGVALLLIFSRWQIRAKWVIGIVKFLSRLAFGIYVLHLQPCVKEPLFGGKRFAALGNWPLPLMVLGVLGGALAIFAACAVVEKLRQLLFDGLRLRKGIQKLEDKWVKDLWNDKEI